MALKYAKNLQYFIYAFQRHSVTSFLDHSVKVKVIESFDIKFQRKIFGIGWFYLLRPTGS